MAHPQPDQQQGRTLLRIGMVTDLHWNGHKEVIGTRHYQDSLTKLNEAIQTFHQQGVDFAVNLGDTLDSLIEADSDLDRLRCTYQSCDFRWYHVLGNHDSDMCGEPPDRHIFVRAFGMAGPYYSFDESDIHFVVLDGNYAEDGVDWSPSWDRTWLGGGQLEWLVEDLRANREKLVFILVHQLAVPPDEEASSDRGHALRDAEQLRAVLESNPNVHAVFCGHHHGGPYSCMNDIHYVTLKGMVDGPGLANNCYAIIEMDANLTIQIQGFGRETSRKLIRLR